MYFPPQWEHSFLEILRKAKTPGVCACVRDDFTDPVPKVSLTKKGGAITLPLNVQHAAQLLDAGEAAPSGSGSGRMLDPVAQRVTQLDASRLKIAAGWNATLKKITDDVATRLGVDTSTGSVEARLYTLALYERDGQFIAHRDTQKAPDVFGTLLVQLPVVGGHAGGKLTMRHGGEVVVWDPSAASTSSAGESAGSRGGRAGSGGRSTLPYAAFYADCQCVSDTVRAGLQLVLVYSLVRTGPGGALPVGAGSATSLAAAAAAASLETLTVAVRQWEAAFGGTLSNPDFSLLLRAVPLEHRYTSANLSFGGLKGRDAAVVGLLRGCGALDVHLALVAKKVVGITRCPDTQLKKRRKWGLEKRMMRAWDPDSGDEAEADGIMTDVLSREYQVEAWVSPPGEQVDHSCIEDVVHRRLLGFGRMFSGLEDPDKEQYLPPTAITGPRMVYWYYRPVAVVWPRSYRASLACAGGFGAALDSLASRLAALEPMLGPQGQAANPQQGAAPVLPEGLNGGAAGTVSSKIGAGPVGAGSMLPGPGLEQGQPGQAVAQPGALGTQLEQQAAMAESLLQQHPGVLAAQLMVQPGLMAYLQEQLHGVLGAQLLRQHGISADPQERQREFAQLQQYMAARLAQPRPEGLSMAQSEPQGLSMARPEVADAAQLLGAAASMLAAADPSRCLVTPPAEESYAVRALKLFTSQVALALTSMTQSAAAAGGSRQQGAVIPATQVVKALTRVRGLDGAQTIDAIATAAAALPAAQRPGFLDAVADLAERYAVRQLQPVASLATSPAAPAELRSRVAEALMGAVLAPAAFAQLRTPEVCLLGRLCCGREEDGFRRCGQSFVAAVMGRKDCQELLEALVREEVVVRAATAMAAQQGVPASNAAGVTTAGAANVPSAGAADAVAAAALMVARGKHLEQVAQARKPVCGWAQPKAVLPGYPKVEAFLRGPEQTSIFPGVFNSVSLARNWCSQHFGPTGAYMHPAPYRPSGGYSAITQLHGTGSSTVVVISKTPDAYQREVQEYVQCQAAVEQVLVVMRRIPPLVLNAGANLLDAVVAAAHGPGGSGQVAGSGPAAPLGAPATPAVTAPAAATVRS